MSNIPNIPNIPSLASLPTQAVDATIPCPLIPPAECVMFVARHGDEDGKVEWTFNVALLKDVEPKHVEWAQKVLCDSDDWEELDVQTAGFLFAGFDFEEEHEDDLKLAQAAAAERKIFFSSTTAFPDHLFGRRRRPLAIVKTYTTSYQTCD
jgi:hypothetical protein